MLEVECCRFIRNVLDVAIDNECCAWHTFADILWELSLNLTELRELKDRGIRVYLNVLAGATCTSQDKTEPVVEAAAYLLRAAECKGLWYRNFCLWDMLRSSVCPKTCLLRAWRANYQTYQESVTGSNLLLVSCSLWFRPDNLSQRENNDLKYRSRHSTQKKMDWVILILLLSSFLPSSTDTMPSWICN